MSSISSSKTITISVQTPSTLSCSTVLLVTYSFRWNLSPSAEILTEIRGKYLRKQRQMGNFLVGYGGTVKQRIWQSFTLIPLEATCPGTCLVNKLENSNSNSIELENEFDS